MPHVQSHRLKALAVTTLKRVSILPELPTASEAGLPGFSITGWYGLLAPAGTPSSVIARLNADLVSTLRQPDVRQKLEGLGLEVETSTPQGFADFLRAEISKYSNVVRSARIRVE
jgi:tripartite-type tricarboxylate transporter receptor subunit TctC